MGNINKATVYLSEDETPYVVMEKTNYAVDRRRKVTTPDCIYQITRAMKMPERAQEVVTVVVFDGANKPICVSEISAGSINRSIVPVREIAQLMLLVGGVSCALTHNHPSGESNPSDDDIVITKKLKDALKMLNLDLLDHIIVSRNGYCSMVEMGVM